MLGSMISLFSGWQIKLILLLALLFGAWTWHRAEVKIAVKEAVSQIEAQQARENFRLKERSLNTQIELQAKADKVQKEKDNEISNLRSRVRTLTDSLRNRPTNRAEPSGVSYNSSNQETQTGATGLQLSRSDATMAIWFAEQATELQIELKSCLRQYDDAKETLDKFKRDNTSKSP